MKTFTLLNALGTALSLGACATPSLHADAAPRPDGLAMLGQSTRVGALIATPQAVVEDSRCPMNARCVWAGRLVVTTRIDGPSWRETADLTLGQPRATHGTSVALTSATPEKMAGDENLPAAMTFGFEGGR